jgi:2-keto-4-pentenoate hydratase/2-oxohepta-3-ene-1,7-dioic acid hydratase in catechol pathway
VIGALAAQADTETRRCTAGIKGVGEVTGTTDAYLVRAPALIAFISQYITLYPGDVVTLGRLDDLLTIPDDAVYNARGYAEIDGIGRVTFELRRL